MFSMVKIHTTKFSFIRLLHSSPYAFPNLKLKYDFTEKVNWSLVIEIEKFTNNVLA